MNLDGDHEVRLNMPGAGKNSISGNHPNITEDVHLHPDQDDSCLRSRKKVVAAKTNLIATTSQSQQQQVEEVTGQLKAKSSSIEPAIPSNISRSTENIQKVSATPTAASYPVTLRTPLLASPAEANDDDDDDESGPSPTIFCSVFGFLTSLYFMTLLCVGINMNMLEYKFWNIEIWKWCCLGLPVSSGFFILDWFINMICCLMKFIMIPVKTMKGSINVDYAVNFYYILLKSSRVFFWLLLISNLWWLAIGPGGSRSIDATEYLRFISKGIDKAAYVAVAWMLRTIAIKFSYASFYNKRFSKRIQENRFHQYILQTLSGPPVRDLSEVRSSSFVSGSGSNVVKSPREIKRSMIETASQIGFYTLPNTLDESKDLINLDERNNRIITTEWKAKAAGDLIFTNVAKLGNKYIEEEDLWRFMEKEEADVVLPLIGGIDESGRIDEKPFLNWVVNMYMKSKFLEHSLDDLSDAMKTLFMFVNVLLAVVLIILWVILMDITTTEVLLFIASQFLVTVFTFGNSAKSTFEAIIFVILKHPYDVGDRCVIDGVQVVVEQVSILTTVFLNSDSEKLYYPNSILATKTIRNLNRSQEMRDTVEFELDVSTSVDNISALKDKFKKYIDSKPHLWQPKHSVWVREVVDVKKVIKMSLYVTHTLNFLDYEVKRDRRSNLVLELRNIFQQLGIKDYHILPSTSSD